MPRVRASFIAAFALLPALSGCGEAPAAEAGTPATVAAAVDALFTAEPAGETRAVIVLRDGRTVAERYQADLTAFQARRNATDAASGGGG